MEDMMPNEHRRSENCTIGLPPLMFIGVLVPLLLAKVVRRAWKG